MINFKELLRIHKLKQKYENEEVERFALIQKLGYLTEKELFYFNMQLDIITSYGTILTSTFLGLLVIADTFNFLTGINPASFSNHAMLYLFTTPYAAVKWGTFGLAIALENSYIKKIDDLKEEIVRKREEEDNRRLEYFHCKEKEENVSPEKEETNEKEEHTQKEQLLELKEELLSLKAQPEEDHKVLTKK